MKFRHVLLSAALSVGALYAPGAKSMPGFFAGKGSKPPTNDATQVIVMMKDPWTVVSVMPDYRGDLKPFAFAMPVPADVSLDEVKTIRRDFIDHVDQITAPRFHEFWEMDGCEPGEPEQIWEQDLTASSDTAFLSGGMMGAEKATRKVAKELQMNVEPQFKDGEYTFSMLTADSGADDVVGWLEEKGYKAPEGAREAAKRYAEKGMNFLIAEVDDKKIELIGGDRAILSPIRYATKEPVKINSTLGLLNSRGKQEIFVYVIDPEKRYEVKNYENGFPPTNIEVDFKVKERMGEFYAAIHDRILEKNPNAFLVEYAWSAKGCGQPCPNEPLGIHELLTLGADVFEQEVPKDEREPEPPEMSEEEKKAFDELKDKEEKKRIESDRLETARRKALIARHNYTITRLHHRYDAKTLTKDIEIGAAAPVEGGVKVPQGPKATLPTDIKTNASVNRLQTRYTFYHPSKAVDNCKDPKKWRWGKPPRTYRGLRKIWVAQDTAVKDRDQLKPVAMVKTPIPSLGLEGAVDAKPTARDGGATGDGGLAGDKKKEDCGCEIPGRRAPLGRAVALLALVGTSLFLRRRPRRLHR